MVSRQCGRFSRHRLTADVLWTHLYLLIRKVMSSSPFPVFRRVAARRFSSGLSISANANYASKLIRLMHLIVCPDQCDSKKIGIVAKHVTCAMVENL
jgi:hypothetical protein